MVVRVIYDIGQTASTSDLLPWRHPDSEGQRLLSSLTGATAPSSTGSMQS
ncbi:hypothetical protein ACHAXT_003779 [Thalassiosira profunda]